MIGSLKINRLTNRIIDILRWTSAELPIGWNMIITLIIVSGITLISVIAVVGDYLTKAKTSKLNIDIKDINKLKKRVEELETTITAQDKKIADLETDISFATKLIEDKTK